MASVRLRTAAAVGFLFALFATGCRSPICPWCGHDIRIPPPDSAPVEYLSAGDIRGQVTTLERGELHPMAAIVIQLYDVTIRAGAQPELVAETRIDRPATLPVRFQLPYGDNLIDASHDYLVSAKLVVGSSVLFETDTKYPVLTHGAPNRLQLVLARRKQP